MADGNEYGIVLLKEAGQSVEPIYPAEGTPTISGPTGFLTINLLSAYQQLQAAFATIHPELEDASRILGATRLQSLRQITAPLLRTGVIATWCFIFIGVMRELSAAIILFTSQTKVLSVLIYDLNESGDLAAIAVLGIAMLIITFAVVLAVNRIPGGNAAA